MGLERPTPIKLSEWADRHFYLSTESSYREGRWKTIAYQRAIMNAISNDEIREITLSKSARVGFTKMIVAAIGYFAEHKRRNQVVFQPVDQDAEDFVKDDIDPMLRDCPAVQSIFPWYNTKSKQNTLSKKAFLGSTLDIRGGKAGKNYRRLTKDVVYYDELDGFDIDIEGEGDPVTLGDKRVEGATFPKSIRGSTPKLAATSQIQRSADAADYLFRYHVPCPHCGHRQALRWGGENSDFGLKWNKGDPSSAAYLCEASGCGALFSYGEYLEHGLPNGIWVAEGGTWIDEDDAFRDASGEYIDTPRSVAFHIWTAYSTQVDWPTIVHEFIKAKGNISTLKTFVNTTLGEAWQEKGDSPDWNRLYERREDYPLNVVPDGAYVLTAFADVQRGANARIEVEVIGWGPNMENWSIDHRVFMGDTSDPKGEPYQRLGAMVNEVWRTKGGHELRLERLGIDSGDQTQTVYNWARPQDPVRVAATKGQASLNMALGAPSAVDVNASGKRTRRGMRVWPVGTDHIKSELFGWLKQNGPTESEPEPPYGWSHFPMYPEEYFKQLCSEQLITTRNKSGALVRKWGKNPGQERNEILDLRVGNRAMAAAAGIDRWRPEDWEARKRDLGMTKPKEIPPDTVTKRGEIRRKSSFW